jgi:hypothetical protein
MKALLISFLLLFSVESFSQRYVSNFTSSYRMVNDEPEFIESSFERNVFTVKDGYIVWTSDDVIYYRIKDVKFIEGTLHYFLAGKQEHPLLLSVKDNLLVLIFDHTDGNRYALKFTLIERI